MLQNYEGFYRSVTENINLTCTTESASITATETNSNQMKNTSTTSNVDSWKINQDIVDINLTLASSNNTNINDTIDIMDIISDMDNLKHPSHEVSRLVMIMIRHTILLFTYCISLVLIRGISGASSKIQTLGNVSDFFAN